MRIARTMLRPTAVLLALAMSAAPALAARPDTRAYTCDQGRALVAQYGSIVMTTGPHTYSRIVHNRGFCGPGEETQLKVVPSLDNPRCRIGFFCRPSLVIGR